MEQRYVQRLALSVGEKPDGFQVIDPTGQSHLLNASALYILECCDEPRSAAEIATMVREGFELDDTPHDLVEACLADLLRGRLVEDAAEVPPRVPQPETPTLEVRISPGVGRGVFARTSFEPGDRIDLCPVIPVGPADASAIMKTSLGRYVFSWEDDGSAVALGHGSLFNHSDTPNADYEKLYHDLLLDITAVQPIAPGQEILIDYTGGRGGEKVLGYKPLPS